MTATQKTALIKDLISLIENNKFNKKVQDLLKTDATLARKLLTFEKKYIELKLKSSKLLTKTELNNIISKLQQYV